MIAGEEQSSPEKLLYLTSVDPDSGEACLSASSRVLIGVLSRDFDVAVGVIGPLDTRTLNHLRVTLGPYQVTGAYEPSRADQPFPEALEDLAKRRIGSKQVSARLQAAIQRKSREVWAVVVDDILAWPYLPAGFLGPVFYVAQQRFISESFSLSQRVLRSATNPSEYQREICDAAEAVFATPDVCRELSAAGVPFRKLQPNYERRTTPTTGEVDLSRSKPFLGYTGFLGDERNAASLHWFIDNIWTVLEDKVPKIELHVVGDSPTASLRQKMERFDNIIWHRGVTDEQLLTLRCRLVIEPLIYEAHVDSKLINAMVRGLPTITSEHALRRAHETLHQGVIAADSREDMVLSIMRLMNDTRHWHAIVREARKVADKLLPKFEMAHSLRRELARRKNPL
ncbi:conserved hypothetical protein [Luminiphilus syltensis NOR5-1B]|uniref:Glycosyltransferase n=1 Tax=Luminiphilus syltensis NOR5-1B TaxID=565045 RepID=B8KXW0_9GAMM|nr:glycosyltransferase [Luminiphilus syltensis]EED34907.1 conserved hypothetical protein [Luminiphilus syltensis NOR5-1B]